MPLQIDPKHIKSEMTTDAELAAALAVKADIASPTFTGTVTAPNLVVTTSLTAPPATLDKTITPPGTTGNQTINKYAGTVNFAAGAETLTVTNSLVTADSIIYCVVRTNNLNSTIWTVVATAGSFVITLSGPADSEISVGFLVFN